MFLNDFNGMSKFNKIPVYLPVFLAPSAVRENVNSVLFALTKSFLHVLIADRKF